MAGSPVRFRKIALVLAAGGFFAVAAAQACSPGTLDSPDSYKGQVDMYAPSTGSGGGGSVGTGGKAGVGTGGSSPVGSTCGMMNVPAGCSTFNASLTAGQCKLCHEGAGATGFATIDFVTDPKGSMVGKPAVYADKGATVMNAASCPAQREVLLNPNDFDKSLFVTKIRGSGFACGTVMPQIGMLTTADRDCLLAWACGLIKN